uniref:VirB4 family type IV secretion system protein n=1 Tax=Thomasclavelia spiroformis TaxID=29348 RepID=UPI00242A60BD
MNIKNQIAPKGLEFKANEFIISDKYATILTVVSYPKFISPGFLSNLTSMAGIKLVIKHIPLPFSTISKMMNKEIAELKQRYQEENDVTIQERIRQDYESLESFISMLAASQSHIYDFQMHIMITADSQDQLISKKIQVKSYIESMEMRAVPLSFEMEKVLKSIIPIFPKQDIEDRIGTPIPSNTMAAMYPFIFDSIKDPGLSTLLGVDFSGGVILFNQFLYQIKKEHNRVNANMIILGTSGSGKSTVAKLLLRSHFRNDSQVIMIDPEGELEDMARLYQGDFIDLGKGGEFGMINPLEVILDTDEEEAKNGLGYTVLTRTLQTLKAFLKYYSPDVTDDIVTLFSEVVIDTYRRFGIDFNTDFTKFNSQDYPTFKDVYATIKGKLLSMT